MLEIVKIKSSLLMGTAYDQAGQTLEIKFRNGTRYRYLEVPAALHEQLQAAASAGRFFHEQVKGKFPWQKVEPELGPINRPEGRNGRDARGDAAEASGPDAKGSGGTEGTFRGGEV